MLSRCTLNEWAWKAAAQKRDVNPLFLVERDRQQDRPGEAREFTLESAGSGRAPRVIMVSIAKSGTHLLQELMLALGYKMFGSGVRLTPQTVPVLDLQTRWRIARMVYEKDAVSQLEDADEARFISATDQAWDALGWSWHIRLAQPLATWYTLELADTGFVRRPIRESKAPTSPTPRLTCAGRSVSSTSPSSTATSCASGARPQSRGFSLITGIRET